jgi:hypothetical protein
MMSITTCRQSDGNGTQTIVSTSEAISEQPQSIVPDLKPLAELPGVLDECSGMIPVGNNLFLAHNDSGNQPSLYLFTSGKKEVKTIRVLNVRNNDWEELADDDQYVYIGDFGNNGGTRQNLGIYKILKQEILTKDEVEPQIISFRYEGQTKYNDSNRHNFDCEAMISTGDSLFLFSKNRGDFRTDVYGMPNEPGEYVISIRGSFDSEGLVTGADYRQQGSGAELVLIGYSIHGKAMYPFILYFPEVKGTRFIEGPVKRLDFEKDLQTETIAFYGPHSVLITNEEEDGSDGRIYEQNLK